MLGHVCFLKFIFWKIIFKIFLYLFVVRKIGQWKILSSQRKIWLDFQKSVFLKNLSGKIFPKIVKNLEISYLEIWFSNFWLLYIYFLFWIFIFQFHLSKFNFYINFGPYFYNCYLIFPYHFLLKFFIYQIWSLFFWLLLILFEIIYEILIIIILISSSFIFFIF